MFLHIHSSMQCFAIALYLAVATGIHFFARYIIKDYYQHQKYSVISTALTAFIGFSLYLLSLRYAYPYYVTYQIFICCLAISIFTDAFALLISELFTTHTIPLAWIAAYYGYLPISVTESIYASIIAALLLKLTRMISGYVMKKEAIGSGDIDIFCFIAAWLSFTGAWFAITFGSCLGAIYGIFQILLGADKKTLQLPLGTFLGIGAIIYLIW